MNRHIMEKHIYIGILGCYMTVDGFTITNECYTYERSNFLAYLSSSMLNFLFVLYIAQ